MHCHVKPGITLCILELLHIIVITYVTLKNIKAPDLPSSLPGFMMWKLHYYRIYSENRWDITLIFNAILFIQTAHLQAAVYLIELNGKVSAHTDLKDWLSQYIVMTNI